MRYLVAIVGLIFCSVLYLFSRSYLSGEPRKEVDIPPARSEKGEGLYDVASLCGMIKSNAANGSLFERSFLNAVLQLESAPELMNDEIRECFIRHVRTRGNVDFVSAQLLSVFYKSKDVKAADLLLRQANDMPPGRLRDSFVLTSKNIAGKR